jgi:hypothetical protein
MGRCVMLSTLWLLAVAAVVLVLVEMTLVVVAVLAELRKVALQKRYN